MSGQSLENGVTPTCWNCGEKIAERYAGTFWKAPDPMPMMWVHVATNDRACGYAEPSIPPVSGEES